MMAANDDGLLTERVNVNLDQCVETSGPVGMRLPTLVRIHEMAGDRAWELPRLDQKFISSTFAYLQAKASGPLTSIETSLLQASAIDLLAEDCRTELDAYEEFCDLRRNTDALSFEIATRADWLRYKRETLRKSGRRRFLGMRRSNK